jgi:hypothetical protein
VSDPSISVVVASRDRPLRLRWLLNALEEQTLGPDRFEVVVCHDSRGEETAALLEEHPLAGAGVLRGITLPPGEKSAGAKRNVAWRLARSPVIAFTDDDCRPPPTWLERALAAAQPNPGAIVQGATRPDPDELALLHACAHPHTQHIDPPVDWAQTCNIVYPRAVLERAAGFDDRSEVEDTDLAWRARAGGARLVGAPEVLNYHAVQPRSLAATVRANWRWRHLPAVVALHPQMRGRGSIGRIFWKPRHARLALAAGGLGAAVALGRAGVGGRTHRGCLAGALAVPWVLEARPSYGSSWRGQLRALAELPGAAAIDVCEFAALAAGSLAARTVFL